MTNIMSMVCKRARKVGNRLARCTASAADAVEHVVCRNRSKVVTSDSKLLYAETKESKCLDNICLGSPPHWKTDEGILLRQCI